MDNTEQIEKLTQKLEQLVEKYLKLQEDNDNLNATIEKLILEKESLINEKRDLESDIDKYNNISKDQGSNIDSMLGKIESLLDSNNESIYYTNTAIQNVPRQEENNYSEPNVVGANGDDTKSVDDNVRLNEKEQLETDNMQSNNNEVNSSNEDNRSKVDLDRMSSLLKGFN